METKHIQHLYWRAGFGINPKDLQKLSKKSKRQIVDMLFEESSTYTPLTVDTTELAKAYLSLDRSDKVATQKLVKLSRQKLLELNTAWITRLMNPTELLREKMNLFWANHFVCRDTTIFYAQHYNNTLRKHALGNFGEFTKAISKEAAMLRYLNTKQNRKAKPNENFGRELLELFTLGTGNYSETDIKEAARSFTGYNHTLKGTFSFRKKTHDFGEKVFLGETGNFDGDEIIDIILKQKQCARFICHKIYKAFVNDIIDDSHINEMVEVFYTDYDIKKLMKHVFMSDWFYNEKNIGCIIKSPIELIAGISTLVPFTFTQPKNLLYLQRMLNQILLYPPNVAGWKGGRTWVDSNTLLIRLKLPSLLLNNAIIALEEKGEFEDNYEMYYDRVKKRKKSIETKVNWQKFDNLFNTTEISDMKNVFLPSSINTGSDELLNQLSMTNKQEVCIQLMSLPEYQLC